LLNLCETESFRKEQLPTGAERILFVDDELVIAKMSKQNLKGLGYQVTMQIDSISDTIGSTGLMHQTPPLKGQALA